MAVGLSQKQLAKVAGISVPQLALLERGLKHPNDREIESIASALGANPSELISVKPSAGEGYVTAMASVFDGMNPRSKMPSSNKKSVVDLFCGVGGFSTGFEATGEFQVVAGVDLLGDRLETFCANHAQANGYGSDIRSLDFNELLDDCPKPYVVIGGPPCQGFSSIRPYRNIEWNDPRNNLGEEFCRAVSVIRPEWLVFENVVGLATHAGGKVLQLLVEAFEELGYKTSARIINAAYHGLPQRRERLIIVGSLRGKDFKWPKATHVHEGRSMAGRNKLLIAPEGGLFSSLVPALTLMDAIGDLPPLTAGQASTAYGHEPQNLYQTKLRKGSSRLALHEATAHSAEMLNIIRHAGDNIHALPPGLVTSGFSSCYSRLAPYEPANTITVNFVHPASNRCIHPFQDRALTPREGARLQSFPDNFRFVGARSQIVKQIGNAVPPHLGQIIAEAILNSD